MDHSRGEEEEVEVLFSLSRDKVGVAEMTSTLVTILSTAPHPIFWNPGGRFMCIPSLLPSWWGPRVPGKDLTRILIKGIILEAPGHTKRALALLEGKEEREGFKNKPGSCKSEMALVWSCVKTSNNMFKQTIVNLFHRRSLFSELMWIIRSTRIIPAQLLLTESVPIAFPTFCVPINSLFEQL
jgi:hypothetical protein